MWFCCRISLSCCLAVLNSWKSSVLFLSLICEVKLINISPNVPGFIITITNSANDVRLAKTFLPALIYLFTKAIIWHIRPKIRDLSIMKLKLSTWKQSCNINNTQYLISHTGGGIHPTHPTHLTFLFTWMGGLKLLGPLSGKLFIGGFYSWLAISFSHSISFFCILFEIYRVVLAQYVWSHTSSAHFKLWFHFILQWSKNKSSIYSQLGCWRLV